MIHHVEGEGVKIEEVARYKMSPTRGHCLTSSRTLWCGVNPRVLGVMVIKL
jgi:hypothetical protein